MSYCIRYQNIFKTFKGRKENVYALKNINLNINTGDFTIISGDNGSGKSTLLKIMMGLLIPDKGTVEVLGIDMLKNWKKASPRIGIVLSNDRSLYWKLTARENLDVFGNLYGIKSKKLKVRISKLLEQVGLLEFQNQLVENYSTGMTRKLMLCKAIIHNPDILFADEILNGLDSKATLEIIELLKKLNKSGMTIVMVSHILHDIPDYCKIIFLKNGEIISKSTLSDLNIQKAITIKATLSDGTKFKETIPQENLSYRILSLTKNRASDIKIEQDNIYDVTRRTLS